MGILADLFVATPPEAATYEETLLRNRVVAEERFAPAQYRNLLDLNFSILWSILANETWELEKHQLKAVILEPPGETWLFEFPAPFVRFLAELDDDEAELAAAKWAATEELQCWKTSDTLPVILDLRRLARSTMSTGDGLYLWGSL